MRRRPFEYPLTLSIRLPRKKSLAAISITTPCIQNDLVRPRIPMNGSVARTGPIFAEPTGGTVFTKTV